MGGTRTYGLEKGCFGGTSHGRQIALREEGQEIDCVTPECRGRTCKMGDLQRGKSEANRRQHFLTSKKQCCLQSWGKTGGEYSPAMLLKSVPIMHET